MINIILTVIFCLLLLRIVLGIVYGLWMYKITNRNLDNLDFYDGIMTGLGFWIGLMWAALIRKIWNKLVMGV